MFHCHCLARLLNRITSYCTYEASKPYCISLSAYMPYMCILHLFEKVVVHFNVLCVAKEEQFC